MDHLQESQDKIEGAVLKTGRKATVFEEIYATIAENEKNRKVDFEKIKQDMENVTKNNGDQGFLVD